ncbi:MAG: phosphatase PAP2 family protein, partial [Acidobacteriota bacterium]|nr:phosphatase PAP2 family protein [Acidobacteriota bacterium]
MGGILRKAHDPMRWCVSAPGVIPGAFMLLVGALMIPADPPLEEIWDRLHEPLLGIDQVAFVLTRSADLWASLLVAGLLLAFAGKSRFRLLAAFAAASIGGALLCEGVKEIVGRARPDALGEINFFAPISASGGFHSFPSGHATNAVVMAIFLSRLFPGARIAFTTWSLAVCCARVTLDRHFFGDVFAGAGLGMLASGIALRGLKLADRDDLLEFLLSKRARLHVAVAACFMLVALPTDASVRAGMMVIVPGVALRLWALGHIRKNQGVCNTGPYALVRHPLYLSSILCATGAAVMANWFPLTVMVVGSALAIHVWLIRNEEAWLTTEFGPAYAEYARTVPALLPNPLRISGGVLTGEFSWKLAAANRAASVVPLALLTYLIMQGKQE